MAIKLSGSVSRKVPIPGLEYSSQSFSAGLEIEINSADPAEVQAQLQQLYYSLNQGIDEQVQAASQPINQARNTAINTATAHSTPVPQQSQPTSMPARNGYSNGRNRLTTVNGNGNGRSVKATDAQCRAIFAICKSQGLDMAAILADYNVTDAKDLHVKTASTIIDDLKSKQAANGNGH